MSDGLVSKLSNIRFKLSSVKQTQSRIWLEAFSLACPLLLSDVLELCLISLIFPSLKCQNVTKAGAHRWCHKAETLTSNSCNLHKYAQMIVIHIYIYI